MNTQIIKKFIFPIIILILSICVVFLYYRPMQNEIKALEDEYDILNGKAGKLIETSRIIRIESNVDSLNTIITEMKERLYPLDEFSDLGRAIEQNGKIFGLNLEMITPEYNELLKIQTSNDEITELPLNIRLKGEFHQFTRFLETLSEFPYVKAKEVTINKDLESTGIIFADVRGVVLFKRIDSEKNESKAIKNKSKI